MYLSTVFPWNNGLDLCLLRLGTSSTFPLLGDAVCSPTKDGSKTLVSVRLLTVERRKVPPGTLFPSHLGSLRQRNKTSSFHHNSPLSRGGHFGVRGE